MKRIQLRTARRASTPADSPQHKPRHGSTMTGILLGVVTLLAVGATATQFASNSLSGLFANFLSDEEELTYLTAEVVRDKFEHRVLERGEVQSSSNVEVRCEVRSRSSNGVQILEIAPEGSTVEAGQLIVRLDDAQLQQELIQQQIIVSTSQSQAIEATAAVDAARLGLKEYEQGTYLEQEEQQESEVFVSQENMRRAEEYLAYSKRLADRGYIPEAQLEADEFAVEKARKDLGVSQTKLRVLRDFTKTKVLTQMKADLATAEARLKSRLKTLELDELRLAEIEDQIKKCRIVSPFAGEIVHANDQERRGSSGDLLVAEGRPVRERQVIIRIPDDSKMRVVAKVHESRIGFVQPGLRADIILESMPDLKLVGRVVGVSEYPIPSYSVYMAHIKEYAVDIDIENPPEGLRPGMTAQVDVLAERIDNAIQIPNQAVIGRNGRFFCAVPDSSGSLATREIMVGSSNEDALVVLDGLEPGEMVVLQPNSEKILNVLDLPEDEIVQDDSADEVGSAPALTIDQNSSGQKSAKKNGMAKGKASNKRSTQS
ncbi:MAG: HlyD family efflux transporter periplasmic adaptor subunit [Planctomycetota bacterium]|nr:HlyD family efflux transporter periplasmic adaptor subunit [Planctomycetota bacterium]